MTRVTGERRAWKTDDGWNKKKKKQRIENVAEKKNLWDEG